MSLGVSPTDKRFRDGVDQLHPALPIGGDDRVADGLQSNAVSLRADAQLRFRGVQRPVMGLLVSLSDDHAEDREPAHHHDEQPQDQPPAVTPVGENLCRVLLGDHEPRTNPESEG